MNDLRAIETERALLGALLRDSKRIKPVAALVRTEDFALETDRNIFDAILRMDLAGRGVDGLTVADELRADKQLRDYLAQCLGLAPTAVIAEEYAGIVAEAGKRRRLRQALQDALTAMDGDAPDGEIMPLLDNAIRVHDEASATGLLSPGEQVRGFMSYRGSIEDGTKPYTRTGIKSLDRILGGGMRDGGLYIISARPGTGKTALALHIADNAAALGQKVFFASLEMSNEELMARRFSTACRIDSRKLLMDKLTPDEWEAVAKAVPDVQSRPVWTVAQSMSAPQIVSMARAIDGLRLVIIDHLTLIHRPGKEKSFEEYAEIVHQLQRLARSIGAPVLLLVQVNREGEKQREPGLADLRGTGAAEEDAAGVMFLSKIGKDDDEPKEIEATPERLRVAKNRFGPPGRIELSFWPKTNTFREAYVTRK